MFAETPRIRADSMDSQRSQGTTGSVSADELDLSPTDHQPSSGPGSTGSATPDVTQTVDAYLPMKLSAKGCVSDLWILILIYETNFEMLHASVLKDSCITLLKVVSDI